MKAMNPPIRGQYMCETYLSWPGRGPARRQRRDRLLMQRHLLAGRRECPRHLKPALLPEDEAHLGRRAQAIGMGWAEGRARAGVGHGTQQVLVKETAFASWFCLHCAPICHS